MALCLIPDKTSYLCHMHINGASLSWPWDYSHLSQVVHQPWLVFAAQYESTSLCLPRLFESIQFSKIGINHRTMSWFQCIGTHIITILLSVKDSNWDHSP